MDENPYESPRETGYRERPEAKPRVPDPDYPAPIVPRAPWLKDRDAIVFAAAIVFLIGVAIILAELLGVL